MKNFFQTLLRGRDPLPDPVARTRDEPRDHERLRQRIRESVSLEERTLYERALGEGLGRAGVAPLEEDAAAVWAWAVCAATDRALAAAWLDRIRDEAALEDIAAHARLADLRLHAAARLVDPDRLARLAGLMRNRDRGVYRHCQAALKQHAERLQRSARIADLAGQLRQLLGARPIAGARLYELRRRLAELEDGPDLADCRALLDQAGQLEQAGLAGARQIDTGVAEARALLKTLEGPDPVLPGDPVRLRIDALETLLGSCPEGYAPREANAVLARLVAELKARWAALDEATQGKAAVPDLRADTGGAEPIPEPDEGREQPPSPAPADAPEAPTAPRADGPGGMAPPPRPPRPAAPRPVDDAGFQLRLEQLAQALDAGASQQAFALVRELDQAAADPARVSRALLGRYRALQGRLGQLRDWVRWSDAQARDKLIEEAEALAEAPGSLPYLAEAVPRLRQEWRRLDGLHRASRAQWQRFDRALNQAYQPVLADRAERHDRQDAIREAKSNLLNEAELWLNGLQEETVNPGELHRQRNALLRHWRGLAPAGPRDERSLQSRFQRLITALDQRLQPCLEAETERRNRLVAAALRLHQEPDLRDAIRQARDLQQQWREGTNGVQLPRGRHEAQWRKFRAAVDGVFARREAEWKQQHEQRQVLDDSRQALLSDLARTLETRPDQPRLEAALAHFRERWEASAASGPPARGRRRDALDRQAEALLQQAETLTGELRVARQRQLFELMARKAAWAEALETAAVAGAETAALYGELQTQWAAASSLPAEAEQVLAARFAHATRITPDEQAAGRQRRDELLLDLEIRLDLPTPPAWSEARQRRQLEWLQGGLRSRQDPAALFRLVAAWYGTPAPPDHEQTGRIEQATRALAPLLLR